VKILVNDIEMEVGNR